MKTYYDKVKEILIQYEISEGRLARQASLASGTITKWRTRGSFPQPRTRMAVVKALVELTGNPSHDFVSLS